MNHKNHNNNKKNLIKIDLGCGVDKLEGYIGLDIKPGPMVDIVHDLTKTPWPFPDNYADVIRSSHVIEHLPNLSQFLSEVTRIGKNGSKLILIFPHYSRSMFSTQHLNHYGIRVLNDFKQFEVESIKLKYTWWGWKHWYKFPAYLFLAVIELLANLSPEFWERVWCYWLGGFDNVIIKARIKK